MLTPATRTMIEKHRGDVRTTFAEPLASKLGRSPASIREEGLFAGDFKMDEGLKITLGDRSSMTLRYAFFVLDEAQGLVGVFTEHCGYFCFPMADLRVVEMRKGKAVARHAW